MKNKKKVNTTKMEVGFEVEVEHDDTWNKENLLELLKEMCRPKFPEKEYAKGLGELGYKCSNLKHLKTDKTSNKQR